jgi:hypothetical protein
MFTPYELSKKQKSFVRKAKKMGFEVTYDYSGRFMYGAKCPAVYLDRYETFSFKGARVDNMGLGMVVYYPA